MAKKVDFIQVKPGTVKKIMIQLSCSKGAVYSALNYHSNSDMANNIRSLALNTFGGVKCQKAVFC